MKKYSIVCIWSSSSDERIFGVDDSLERSIDKAQVLDGMYSPDGGCAFVRCRNGMTARAPEWKFKR